MKLITTSLFTLFVSLLSFAQYTTPDTGVSWTLDDIATDSPTTITVSGTTYTLLEDLTVAESDALIIDEDITLAIEADVRVTVFGSFTVDADDVLITAVDQESPYEGFRFEEFSEINIQNATIEYGGGLQVLTETFTLNNCLLQNNVSGVATGATVTLSRGTPIITNNQFLFNNNPAISSGATNQVSAYIFNNYIEGNNQINNNRPQINMGVTRAAPDTLKIIGNTIKGDRDIIMAGGIAVANFVEGSVFAIIKDNSISDNRYGIALLGNNDYVEIKNNIIEDNDTQNIPLEGGSGINFLSASGDQNVFVSENQIRRNLWGVTIQQQNPGDSNINFGDDEDNLGRNVFSENGNGGETYALFNNTPNEIMAKHNCWVEDGEGTLDEAEGVISHVVDDPSLGEVIFDPINCEELNTSDQTVISAAIYPNPSTGVLHIESATAFDTVQFYNINGQLVFEKELKGKSSFTFDLSKGMYFVELKNQTHTIVQKLIVK